MSVKVSTESQYKGSIFPTATSYEVDAGGRLWIFEGTDRVSTFNSHEWQHVTVDTSEDK